MTGSAGDGIVRGKAHVMKKLVAQGNFGRIRGEVQTIRRFADANGLAVWDMYDVFGGVRRACLNWQEAKLMRPDHVHYLPEGYVLQGEMFYQALLKAYNDYCSR